MKKLKNIFPLLFIVFLSTTVYSQSTEFNIERKINFWDKDSKTKNITVEVKENTNSVSFNINCKVLYGNITIEILDPKGKKHGNFSVKNQMNKLPLSTENNKEEVNGQINKHIGTPKAGNWIIKIIPLDAIGQLSINCLQQIK